MTRASGRKQAKVAATAASPSTVTPTTITPTFVVPGLITAEQSAAVSALTKEQRIEIGKELVHILTEFPQGADGERTPSGGCPCGGCYKCDDQIKDSVNTFAAVVQKYGQDIVRWHCIGLEGQILPLLLTIYLNLPAAAQRQAAMESKRARARARKQELKGLKAFHESLQQATVAEGDDLFRIVDANNDDVLADDEDGYATEEAATKMLMTVREQVSQQLQKAQATAA